MRVMCESFLSKAKMFTDKVENSFYRDKCKNSLNSTISSGSFYLSIFSENLMLFNTWCYNLERILEFLGSGLTSELVNLTI
jgi:hypothetical protein